MMANRLLAVVLATATVIGASTTASAADIPANAPAYKAPAVITNIDWSGFYAGVSAGYGSGKAPATISPKRRCVGPNRHVPADKRGAQSQRIHRWRTDRI